MTQADIYTKFMIEYDKANITSSYPSLTKYEIATILDKAYLALIAQKITGNNPRKAPFEYDTKSIEDVRHLEVTKTIFGEPLAKRPALNEYVYEIPSDYLYYVDSTITNYAPVTTVDNFEHSVQTTVFLNHELAKKFRATDTNMPWIKQPIVYIEGNNIKVLFDPYKHKDSLSLVLNLIYIKKPAKFIDNIDEANVTDFELSDSMAEELINLAIVIATETVEQPRLQTKLSTLSLES